MKTNLNTRRDISLIISSEENQSRHLSACRLISLLLRFNTRTPRGCTRRVGGRFTYALHPYLTQARLMCVYIYTYNTERREYESRTPHASREIFGVIELLARARCRIPHSPRQLCIYKYIKLQCVEVYVMGYDCSREQLYFYLGFRFFDGRMKIVQDIL